MNNKSILIFAPFFNNPKHVGGYRIRRVIKWLSDKNFKVNVISLGKISETQVESWGSNIIIHSASINFLERLLKIGLIIYPIKLIYIFLKFILKVIYLPDEEMLWVNKVVKSKKVLELANSSNLYFSSSPLESAHIATFKLSKKFNKQVIVDLRDGWMDESLKYKLFRSLKFQEKFEKKLEKRVLTNSSLIFVTTLNWKNRLVERYPELKYKISVLTNAYPNITPASDMVTNIEPKSNEIVLYYTGRFAGSSRDRRISLLFKPFNDVKIDKQSKINIKIYSDLRRVDQQEINSIKQEEGGQSYSFEILDFIPRTEILEKLNMANGLLLLSVSKNAIPAKFFEYVTLKKPVLVITYKNNSVWDICSDLPQFFLYNLEGTTLDNNKVTLNYLRASRTGEYKCVIPEKYSEDSLGKTFWNKVEDIIHNPN